ncbi:MAG: hypothetical protein Q9223_007166, partial [Gallowayella weberi]
MAAPKKRFQHLRTTLATLFILLILPFLLIYAILSILLTLPYTLFHFSSNYGLRASDMPIVEKYLDIFQTQNPRLAGTLDRYFRSDEWKDRNDGGRVPRSIKFWPNKSTTEYAWLIVSASVTDWSFSVVAGLFVVLEELYFPRRLLWEFLMREVESKSPSSASSSSSALTEADKAEFRRVMEKMCTGYVPTMMIPGKQWRSRKEDARDGAGGTCVGEKGFSLPEQVP